MAELNNLQKDVQLILDSMRTYVEKASELSWTPSDGYLTVVLRAILRRQFEALEVISHLVTERNGFIAGPLLRPACEEVIWATYLISIPSDDAQELIPCIAQGEVLKSLRAQDQSAGRSVTKTLGLLPYLKRAERGETEMLNKRQDLGRRLNWPKRDVESKRLPTIRWFAKRTNHQDTYKSIYHATSRFVHFSGVELLRRAWGNPYRKSVSISSDQFGAYWSQFSLYWGLKLLLETEMAVWESLDIAVEMDHTTILEAAERIGEIGKPPIITSEELNWPI